MQTYFLSHINYWDMDLYLLDCQLRALQSSGSVWKSRWPSWTLRPNEPYGFRGRKAILNTFIGRFPSDGAASMEVKGVNLFCYKSRKIAHHHWATILELLSYQKRRVDATNRNTEKFVSALLSSIWHLIILHILFRLGRWWEQLQTFVIGLNKNVFKTK